MRLFNLPLFTMLILVHNYALNNIEMNINHETHPPTLNLKNKISISRSARGVVVKTQERTPHVYTCNHYLKPRSGVCVTLWIHLADWIPKSYSRLMRGLKCFTIENKYLSLNATIVKPTIFYSVIGFWRWFAMTV